MCAECKSSKRLLTEICFTCRLSAEDSDIEGMEVIGEDGENVEEEDMEIQNNAEEEEAAEENEHQAERTDSPEKGINKYCSRKCQFNTRNKDIF